jgi:hypothetical protein
LQKKKTAFAYSQNKSIFHGNNSGSSIVIFIFEIKYKVLLDKYLYSTKTKFAQNGNGIRYSEANINSGSKIRKK